MKIAKKIKNKGWNMLYLSSTALVTFILWGISSYVIWNLNDKIVSIISMTVGLFSIFVGGLAIFQAIQYNKAAEKFNKESTDMLNKTVIYSKEVFSSNNAIYETLRTNFYKGELRFTKDEARLYKINYKVENKDKVQEVIKKLRPYIKEIYIDTIKDWLQEDDSLVCSITLKNELSIDKIRQLEKYEDELSNLGLLFVKRLV